MSLRTFTKEELATILEKHAKWLINKYCGERANLTSADLRYADLTSANLRYADLTSANLTSANLRSADLTSANLRYANLTSANLTSADLTSANLRYADLTSANLTSANLTSANLTSTDLTSAVNAELAIARTRTIPSEGSIVGWKKCSSGVLVKIKVPDDAKRSNAFGRKCRAAFVDVLQVVNAEFGISIHDGKTRYEVGQRVNCDKWNDDWQEECAGGIHFYITKEEAEAHS